MAHSEPRTYLVPDRTRTRPPPEGLWQWLVPVFRTNTNDFIGKCGLDAYFFLRYLRMLLKIFIPAAIFIVLILVPLNKVNGRGASFATGIYGNSTTYSNVTGLDQLAWGNVRPTQNSRYWAHLVLAVFLVVYVCYVFYDELIGYIRLRQAYLTSPQHRMRASATTVLVTNIPREWLTFEALDGLYDVFPGGVRNIWINRNYDSLGDKVKQRNAVAVTLEAAYTTLIRKSKKAYLKRIKKTGEPNKVEQYYKDQAEARAERARAREADSNETAEAVEQEPQAVTEEARAPEEPQVGAGEFKESQVVPEQAQLPEEPEVIVRDFAVFNARKTAGAPEPKAQEHPADVAKTSASLAVPVNITVFPPVPFNPSAFPAVPTTTSPFPAVPANTPASSADYTNTFTSPRVPTNTPTSSADYTNTSVSPAVPANTTTSSTTATDTSSSPTRPPWEEDEDDGEPTWKMYLAEKDRDTMRLPLFGLRWMPALPLIGKKVDVIEHCRKELARLNVEIAEEQQEPEKFPLMNSAFIQFNNQVAAHMACQAVSHHIPHQMAPRVVEISPDDVIWDNMSIKWWESYLRTALVVIFIIGLTLGWAIPVTFTGLLSQVRYLSATFPWLEWLGRTPSPILAIIQGVLPQVLLGLLLFVLPVILRLLLRFQGHHTGMAVELSMQSYYFFFLFVQVFLVVSISSGITTVIQQVTKSPQSVPSILAQNLPKASNYFFSYLVLQAMSTSSGALLQIWGLIQCFILAPLFDKTARRKWMRQTSLPTIGWGSFFPVYTNLAAIGLIYSVISPLILIFCIFTFGLFWVVYRYNTLYVTNFRLDTGGLLFPKAIKQLFTGVYVMELCLIGLFFLVRDVDSKGNAVGTPCKGQAIVMIIVFIGTIMFQWFLNASFGPLIRYLPITLEDEAVERDELFALQQDKKWNRTGNDNDSEEDEFTRRRRSLVRHRESFEEDFVHLHNKGVRLCNAMDQLDMDMEAAESDSDSSLNFGEPTISAEAGNEDRVVDSEGISHNKLGKKAYDFDDPGFRQNTSDTDLYGVSTSEDRRRRKRRREYYNHLQERQQYVVEEHQKYLDTRNETRRIGAGGTGFDGQDERGNLEKPPQIPIIISNDDHDARSIVARPQGSTTHTESTDQDSAAKGSESYRYSGDLGGRRQSDQEEEGSMEAIGGGNRHLSRDLGRIHRPTIPTITTRHAPEKMGWAEKSRRDWAARYPQFGHGTSKIRERKHTRQATDLEAQKSHRDRKELFTDIKDELEDLTRDERDKLVRRAFQHEALRSKRPIIWIPRDELGVSDDEVYLCQRFSKHIWISNAFAALDGKGRVVFARGPPDFDEIDLIEL